MTETAFNSTGYSSGEAKGPARDPNAKPGFSANMTFGGGNRPHFDGYISEPGSEVRENMVLWSGTYTDNNGEVLSYWNGNTTFADGMTAMEKIQARAARKAPAITIGGKDGSKPLVIEDGRILMYQAKRDGSNIAGNGKRRTDTYGYWNKGGRLVVIGGWINDQEGRGPSIVGNTQWPLEKDLSGEPSHGAAMSQDDINRMHEMAGAQGQEADMPAHLMDQSRERGRKRARSGMDR